MVNFEHVNAGLVHATSLFMYPLRNMRRPLVFLCFQEVSKETSGMKRVNKFLATACK